MIERQAKDLEVLYSNPGQGTKCYTSYNASSLASEGQYSFETCAGSLVKACRRNKMSK